MSPATLASYSHKKTKIGIDNDKEGEKMRNCEKGKKERH